jgi:transcription-repair coupling factor (superfamily II helicase)
MMAFVVAHLFEERQTQLLIVEPDTDHAEQLRDDCSLLLDESVVHLYVSGPTHAAKLLDMSAPIAKMEAIRAVSRSERVLVIASAEALTMKLPLPRLFAERTLELETNREYPFEQLTKKLAELGFDKKDFVEEYGDFAVRGGIVDIFPFIGDNPVRFEFWGDTVESIREFDVLSQRSIRELQKASVVARLHPGSADSFQPIDSIDTSDTSVSLFEYLSADTLIFLNEPLLIEKEVDELFKEGHKNIFDWKTLESKAIGFPLFIHSTLRTSNVSIDIDFNASSQPSVGGSVKRLISQLEQHASQGNTCFIACDTNEEGKRL